MPSRLSLPLWIPALVLAAGCVTVRPPAPAEAPVPEPAAARTVRVPRPPATAAPGPAAPEAL
ncbi:polysaccharide deacetylase, partial [Streptomyces sp. NPDC127112]